ncbi:MAG TPA: PPC domain-containing DNA-binding protein [Anaeromyxobacteraceae bacterium]|nr:PPC domain-containing DNA-binding protein [Anaeromyxobacteraceae bacterium]
MIVKQTRQTRTLLGRLVAGEEVVASLREIVRAERVDAGWLRAHGVLEDAEVALWNPLDRRFDTVWREVGPAELASLSGTIALRGGFPDIAPRAVLMCRGPRNAAVAGLLLSARALVVEFAVDVYDDAEVHRLDDPDTGLAPWDP